LFYPISNIVIEKTQIDETIQQSIQEKFITDAQVEEVEAQDIKNPSKVITNYIEQSMNDVKNTGINSIAFNLSRTIVRIGVAIILFVIAKILLYFFRKFAEKIAELPIIKQFNKSGGTIYGVLKGLIIVYIILGGISLIAPMISQTTVFEQINKSYIGSFMYNYNILLMLIF